MVDGRKNFAGPRIDMNIDALDSVSMREETEPNIHEKGRIGPV
jgi:choline transport protein